MRYRHKTGSRRGVRAVAAACATVLAAAMLVVFNPAPPASAATYTFLIDSLSPIGNDLNPGDGICRTSTNVCTLRAALQESNALGALGLGHQVTISPAADVDSSTPGVQTSGTIVGSGAVNTTNFMFVGTLTNQGDAGAYFMATQPVTIDFQNRLGIRSLDDSNGATGIYINGPDVSVRNFDNIKTNETAFVVGGAGDRATIENGKVADVAGINAERAIWIADGVDDLTIRRVLFDSLWDGGPGAIMFAASARVNNLMIDQITMQNSDGDAYDGIISAGGQSTRPVVTNMTIQDSTFTQFPNGARALMLDHIDFSGALITGNTFTLNNYGGSAALYWSYPSVGDPNVISKNTFDESGPGSASYGIYVSGVPGPGIPVDTVSGWRIEDNYFDGYSTNAILLGYAGTTLVQRNRFGIHNASAGTNNEDGSLGAAGKGIDEETRHWGFFYNYWAHPLSNDRRRTWYPTLVTADPLACTATVTVTPPTAFPWNSSLPTTPVTIDVYYTSIADGTNAYAEVYLGRQTGISAAGTQITVPYTLGAGYLRLQTADATGKSSQYSRVIALTVPDTCGPRVTLEQAVVQNDPAVQRDLQFTVTTSEPLAASGAGALAIGDFSLTGSSAPNARVTAVTQTSETSYRVTARADGAGTVQLSLLAGVITDVIGNASLPSTSVDNVVTYVSPLSISPANVTVTEGGATATYTITNTVAATAPISFAPVVANPAWASVTPAPVVMNTDATTAVATVTAVDDTIVNGTRNTSVSHTVSSADLEFDGLIVAPVAVQVNDNDLPDATLSTLETTPGVAIADGVATHTGTVTARNSAGTPVQGATIIFNGSPELTRSANQCVTAASGQCSITVTATEFGTFNLTASIGGVGITGSPGQVQFGAGPPDAGTSLISAAPAQIVADGVSSALITVTAYDAQGNRVTVGGADVVIATTGGTLTDQQDNGDGTYTALLTAPTTAGAATLTFTIGPDTGTDTSTVTFLPGEVSPARSTISSSQTSITADGTATSDITVRLFDAYDNPVTTGTVGILTSLGTISDLVNHGDGTVTATLTSATTAGTATVSFTVNGVGADDTVDVEMIAGAADAGTSLIEASPTSILADGSATSTITVRLMDANDNPLTASGGVVNIVSSPVNYVTNVVDGGDGTYTATLTAPTAVGSTTVSFTLDGDAGANEAEVTFVAGPPSAATSQISVAPTSLPADAASTAEVTVTLRDAFGNPVTTGGAEVLLATANGTVTIPTDNGDGTYTGTYTAGTVAGPATITFTVGGAAGANTAALTLVAGGPSLSTSTIVVDPTTIDADGSSQSTATVTLFDQFGNRITHGGGNVEIVSDRGTYSTTDDHGDGTYTATITASTNVEAASVSFSIDGDAATATATVQFIAGAASLSNSTISASEPSITADGTSTSTITVTLYDANENRLTASGGSVVIGRTLGSLTATTDNGDGTYTATLTAGTVAGTSDLSFTINGNEAVATANVAFVPGPLDLGRSTITADQTSIPAGGFSTTTITVRLMDANGNLVGPGARVVDIVPTMGTLGPITDNGDGTYSAELTSAETATTSVISYTVDTQPGTNTLTIVFTPGEASPSTSTISASPTSITADGVSTSTVTVTTYDAYGNLVTDAGPVVEITSDAGTYSATTDNGDGTYTATVTSSTVVETAVARFTLNALSGGAEQAIDFVVGAPSATTSTIVASPTSITADGVSTSTATVTAFDANGNRVNTGGANVVIDFSNGTFSPTVDNGDGTYTATVTSPTAVGSAAVSFTMGATPGTATASVVFVAGAPSAGTSTISASPTSITADGASTSTVTVTLLDANGNLVTTAGDVVAIGTDVGTVGATTNNGDGTYSATLTSATTAGTATASFTVSGNDAAATATVEFVAGAPSAGTSTISASPTSITADGVSTSTVTVTLLDANGNLVTTAGDVVAIGTDVGTVGATTNNGDGTYSATLTSVTTAGTATVSFTVSGNDAAATATVEFVAGAPSAGTSTISASPTSITADGVSTSTVTVTLLDANGNLVTTAGDVVAIGTDVGTVGATTNNGDGTYSATLTSVTTAGTATVSFTVSGNAGTATASVVFVAGAPSAGTSTISASPTSITADGASTSTVTVTLLDANGNLVTTAGDVVAIGTDVGTVGATTNNGDGTYSATLTSATTAGTATVSFTVSGNDAAATATVGFVAGAPSAGTSTIVASPTSITADGASTSTVTVTLLDANGNLVTTAGDVVAIGTDVGTVGATTNNGDGTYSATLTSVTTAGTATVSFTVSGNDAAATATVEFVAGAPSAGTSTISASPTSITADGTSTSTVTVTLRDPFGNPLTSGGATVVITSNAGTYSATTDNGDGTYSATLTSATVVGTATASFTVGGIAATATATVDFVAGAPSTSTSQIVATPTEITADAASTSDVKVTLLDAFGNPVPTGTNTVEIFTSAGSIGTATSIGGGVFVAELTSTTVAGTVATLTFSVNGSPATPTASVLFVAGAASTSDSTISASPTSITADGVTTSTVTVTLVDVYGNPLQTGGVSVDINSDIGTVGATTDNGDGTYTATLTSATAAGTATVSFLIGASAGDDTVTVDFVAGAPDATTSTISASPTSITADGVTTSTVTVTLLDANGNLVTTAGDVVAISTDAGTVGATTDNGDGTYTATLTSATTAGTATVSFTVEGNDATATETVDFVAGTVDPGSSLIAASPTSITADGVSTSMVTVTLRDAFGNPLTSGGRTVVISRTAGTLDAVSDNGDGTYSAQLTSATTAGTSTLTFTVDTVPGGQSAVVQFTPGQWSPSTSRIVASPTDITADGVATSTVTVTLEDAQGNQLDTGGSNVVVSTTRGTVSGTTDNGDGTYTVTLTSSTVAGAATLSFTVDGQAATDTALILMVPGAASPTLSTIEASPTSVTADGTSTSTVTVRLVDAQGNALTGSGGTVVIHTTAGILTPAVDNGDGTYTATLTAPATLATSTLTFSVSGAAATDTATVAFVPGALSASDSTIQSSVTELQVDLSSEATITVTARDAYGNPLGSSAGPVTMSTTAGTLGPVTDNGDGTYTATLSAPDLVAVAVVTFTINGTAGTRSATVTFLPGVASPSSSTIAAAPVQIVANGSSTSTVTVTLIDGPGNPLTAGGDTVTMATTHGTLSGVTDNGNGTYTATLTSATTVGTAVISFRVNNADASRTASVEFVPGPADPGQSQIVASPGSLVVNSGQTSAVTVILRDAFGNRVLTGGRDVSVTASHSTLTSVADNGDGTYTATLLADSVPGTAVLNFTIDDVAGTSTASVDMVIGPPSPAQSTISAAPTTIESDGTSTSTVTVQLVDAFGNALTTGGPVVGMSTTAGTLGAVTDNGDGTYTAVLTSAVAPAVATVSFTLDAVPGAASVQVRFQDTTPPPPPTVTGPTAGATVHVVATFTGTGEPGSRVTVTDSTGRDLCSATVDASGLWSCTPAFRLTPGPLTFNVTQTDASGNTSSVGSAITIEVVGPVLNIDVAQLQRGQQQSVTGTGFIPGEVVAGLVQSTPLDLGTAVADAQGTVTFTFVVPADFEIGTHTVTLTGELSGPVAGQFEVVASRAAPIPVLPVLPRTGADGWIPAAVLSGFTLLLGAMLLVWRRRRSRREMFGRFGI